MSVRCKERVSGGFSEKEERLVAGITEVKLARVIGFT